MEDLCPKLNTIKLVEKKEIKKREMSCAKNNVEVNKKEKNIAKQKNSAIYIQNLVSEILKTLVPRASVIQHQNMNVFANGLVLPISLANRE